LDATVKLLRVNPFHDLRKNRLSGAHFASLAPHLLAENAKLNPYRSHHKNAESPLFSIPFADCHPAQPDDSD
jgi:hypothetical protein